MGQKSQPHPIEEGKIIQGYFENLLYAFDNDCTTTTNMMAECRALTKGLDIMVRRGIAKLIILSY